MYPIQVCHSLQSSYQIFYRDIPYFTPEGIPQAVVLPPDMVWVDEGGVLAGKRYYRMVVDLE